MIYTRYKLKFYLVFLHLYTRDIWKYRLFKCNVLTRAKLVDFNNSDIHITAPTLRCDMVRHSPCCSHLTGAHAHPSQNRPEQTDYSPQPESVVYLNLGLSWVTWYPIGHFLYYRCWNTVCYIAYVIFCWHIFYYKFYEKKKHD